MNQIKVIKTEHEHQHALNRLMSLMDLDPEPGTSESDEFDVLALLIEHYEQKNFPIDPPDPVDAIKFRMDQQQLSQKDLVPYIGSASKVSEVLKGKRPLSLNMVRKLSQALGISADVLVRESSQLEAGGEKIDWAAFPLKEMHNKGYFPDFEGTLRDLKEYSQELVSKFLSGVPGDLSLKPALLRSSAHLRSNDKSVDQYSLWAWQVRVLKRAQEERLTSTYVQGSIDIEFMRRLAQQSWSSKGPLLAKEFLNQHGIHLIFEPHLPKTYLDGAVCMDEDGRPVIAVTLRHDRLDSFWFTLMHELSHVALHVPTSKSWFIDDLDAPADDDAIEREADNLAQEALIPASVWESEKPSNSASVRRFAERLSLHPSIVAGRLRHERSNHRLFGSAFREAVKPAIGFSNS